MSFTAAADSATRQRSLFHKPSDAQKPNGKVKAIIAAGGTFLCKYAIVPRKPTYYENFLDFVEGCNLADEFQRRGLYQDEETKEFFLRDGTQIAYFPIEPSIDSTEATSEGDRLEILKTSESARETLGPRTDIVLIQGTDTAAETAAALDLIGGREMKGGTAVVTSQLPADAPGSDGPDQFWSGFDGTDYFKQVIAPSKKGEFILNANFRKGSDDSFGIHTPHKDGVLGLWDMGQVRNPAGMPIPLPPPREESSELSVQPTKQDYESVAIKHYEPTKSGNQTIQAILAAFEISSSLASFKIRQLVGPSRMEKLLKGMRRLFLSKTMQKLLPENATRFLLNTVVELLSRDGYSGVTVTMAGSNNIPRYSIPVLKATDNMIPIFATSSVPGAKSGEGTPKYASAGIALAKELGLNNWIELPATKIGPDMRPEMIMAYAAKYAPPRSAENLLLCHLLASFAWTPEDNKYSSAITGERHSLVSAIRQLESSKAKICTSDSAITVEQSRTLLNSGRVKDLLLMQIPQLVDTKGQYHLTDDGKLETDRKNFHRTWFDSRPTFMGTRPSPE